MDEDRIRGAAGNIGGKVKDAVGGLTGDTQTQAEGKLDQVTGRAQNAYGSVKDEIRQGMSTGPGKSMSQGASAITADLDSFVSERPMTALLAAVGIGYVLARLMHR
ncbi:MAG: hypothetical protein NVS2B11_17840 [Acetobacteraceae bacterium]